MLRKESEVCTIWTERACTMYVYSHRMLPEPSGPPLSLSAEALGPTSLRMRWEPPNCVHLNSQRATSYIIQHGPAGASQLEETSVTTGLSRVLETLPTFTVYSVRVLAVNEEGRGPPSVMVEVALVDGKPLSITLIFYCHVSCLVCNWKCVASYPLFCGFSPPPLLFPYSLPTLPYQFA